MHFVEVHGDIRHLEKFDALVSLAYNVHGDIRHLESELQTLTFI